MVIHVTIQVTGNEDRNFTFETPITVSTILDTAHLNPDNFVVRLNGRVVETSKEIRTAGDYELLLTKKVQGA